MTRSGWVTLANELYKVFDAEFGNAIRQGYFPALKPLHEEAVRAISDEAAMKIADAHGGPQCQAQSPSPKTGRTMDHVAKFPLVGDIIKFAETTEEVGGFCEVMHVSEYWIGYRNHSDDRPEWNTRDEWAEDCRKPNCSLIRGGDHDFPF